MTLRQYIAIMSMGTAVCGSTVALIVIATDPEKTGAAVFVGFYAGLFLTLAGAASLVGILLRLALLRERAVIATQAVISFRQGALISFVAIAGLLLNNSGLWTWINVLLLMAAAILLECFMSSLGQKSR